MHESITHVGYLWLIPALPLLGVVFNAALGARLGKAAVRFVAPGTVGLAFLVALRGFADVVAATPGTTLVDHVYSWIAVGPLQLDVTFSLDPLSALMTLVVTGVGFLIHVYSTGYMAHDASYARYFTYLNLFTVAMLILVLGDNLVLLFVGWEGVGLCSYLLIGFWYEDVANAAAGKKAFIVNRIGDAGFLLAVFLLFWQLGGAAGDLSFRSIATQAPALAPGVVTAVCLLLFVGATGKSAQIPLYVWLPDAMAGPTPVSALIHAATMVTAGIYLVARMHFLYVLSPTALAVVAVIGALTAVFAATIGLAQNDIKKVLAYSTVSQLGYMFLALGVGAFTAAIFHVMTHAFFKALLFLGSGSVIHALDGEQDMRRMGGLRRHLPVTFWTFLIATGALAGLPPLAGFFSKDEILFTTWTQGHHALWALGFVGAGLTAFYMTRLVLLTFFGDCRASAEAQAHLHESPPSMTMPLVALAVLSVVGGWVGLPMGLGWGHPLSEFLAPVFEAAQHGAHGSVHHDVQTEIGLMVLSVGIALAGIVTAWMFYRPGSTRAADFVAQVPAAYDLVANKYYVDEAYDAAIVQPTVRGSTWLWQVADARVIDGAVNAVGRAVAGTSERWRRLQDGDVQHYALGFLAGAVVLVALVAW